MELRQLSFLFTVEFLSGIICMNRNAFFRRCALLFLLRRDGMKRIIAFSLVFIILLMDCSFAMSEREFKYEGELPEYFRIEEPRLYFLGENDSKQDSLYKKLLASGCTIDRANQTIENIKNGKPITKYRIADHDTFNSPAEKNGLGGTRVRAMGTVTKYVKSGSKKEAALGLILTQEDGKQWLISYGYVSGGRVVIGCTYSENKMDTIFDGYEGERVEVYGEYTGFSESFKLPVIELMFCGGMYVESSNTFVYTSNAEYHMSNDDLRNLHQFIGIDVERKTSYCESYWRK